MDGEPEELQFLGVLGVCGEASKIILSCRKLLSQITLSLIIPLSLVFLAHIKISDVIFSDIDRDVNALEYTPDDSPRQRDILSSLSSDWLYLLLFKSLYLLLVLIFSLLSTSAVVYTIASVYTAKPLSLPRVLSVVPRVWKRLLVTFFWAFLILFAYNSLTALLLILTLLLFPPALLLVLASLLLIAYLVGFVYVSIVWHLASVVSVLEDAYGISAMRKSRSLIRGKVWTAVALFVTLNSVFIAIHFLFAAFVVRGHGGLAHRAAYGLLLLLALAVFILIGLVVQTVVYFVCKAYHHENIDKSILADHLEVYLGEYVPLTDKSVQMEHIPTV